MSPVLAANGFLPARTAAAIASASAKSCSGSKVRSSRRPRLTFRMRSTGKRISARSASGACRASASSRETRSSSPLRTAIASVAPPSARVPSAMSMCSWYAPSGTPCKSSSNIAGPSRRSRADAVDAPEVLDDIARALCTLVLVRPFPQRRLRRQRAIELNRRPVDLFDPDGVRVGRNRRRRDRS